MSDKPQVNIDTEYQNIEIAKQAFFLRTHLKVLGDEIEKFKELTDDSEVPDEVQEWLHRVHRNLVRNFSPSIDNLDQVRFVMDKKTHGLPK